MDSHCPEEYCLTRCIGCVESEEVYDSKKGGKSNVKCISPNCSKTMHPACFAAFTLNAAKLVGAVPRTAQAISKKKWIEAVKVNGPLVWYPDSAPAAFWLMDEGFECFSCAGDFDNKSRFWFEMLPSDDFLFKIEFLNRHARQLLFSRFRGGETIAHLAASEGKPEVILFLMEYCSDLFSSYDDMGYLPTGAS